MLQRLFGWQPSGQIAGGTPGTEGGCGEAEQSKLQISPLRYPRFPVEFRGVDKVLASLFAESRIRGRCWLREVGNLGTLRSR
jgi:hypothetical protein